MKQNLDEIMKIKMTEKIFDIKDPNEIPEALNIYLNP